MGECCAGLELGADADFADRRLLLFALRDDVDRRSGRALFAESKGRVSFLIFIAGVILAAVLLARIIRQRNREEQMRERNYFKRLE